MAIYRYQIAFTGRPWFELSKLETLIHKQASDLGLDADAIRILHENDISARDRKSPLVAVFFGYVGAAPYADEELEKIHEDSLPIIPVVQSLDAFRAKVPSILEPVNGLAVVNEADLARLVSTIFENLQLLREERRLFISYRRVESTAVAIQLFEALDERGFDVFLDTRSVRPAVNFQAELWHRLSDSDIVVLLDTPDFRISNWTKEELTRANSTNIQILHLLWPGVSPDPTSSFSEFFPLELDCFLGGGVPHMLSRLKDGVITEICRRAESLRARALAARYAHLVDNFCDLAKSSGHDVSIHPERYLSLSISGRAIAVFPMVGIPTSPRLEAFEAVVSHVIPLPQVRVIYDERGVLDKWRSHLGWLSRHLPVKAVQMMAVQDALASGQL